MAIAVAEDSRGPRLAAIDVARGVAIGAMVVYHAAYDLSIEGLIAADVPRELGWRIFARLIAGTFLALVGINLVLASRRGFRPQAFMRRLAIIAGSAALVSLVTWWAVPGGFVFFGILHQIALSSVLALPFLWLPSWLVALAAAVVIAIPAFVSHPVFDAWPLLWLGLYETPPVSIDYVPVFPWFGVALAGIVAGRLIVARGLDMLARWNPEDALSRAIMFAGRWSLLIYLIHQPILVGLIWAAEPILTPSEAVARQNFTASCEAACVAGDRDAPTCNAFCGCMFDGLYGTDLFEMDSVEAMTDEQSERWTAIVDACVQEPPAAPEQ